MLNVEDTVDISGITADDATISYDDGRLSVELINANISGILEEIGEERVRQYFGIKEEL